jgi:serine/threonine protein phosphatase PrpC
MSVRITAVTHPGTERERNEDAVGAAGWRCQNALTPVELSALGPEPIVTIVADGVGGHPGGDVASALTVDHLLAAAPRIGNAEDLEAALLEAHRHVCGEQDTRTLSGMASTAAVVVVTEHAVLVGNVGDSRVYEFHEGQLLQLSIDDRHPNGDTSVVTQVLGGFGAVPTPHVTRLRREPALRFVLCSDGLTEALGEPGVADVIGRHAPDWPSTVAALIDASLDRGAPDNVSIAIVAVDA